MCSLLVLRNIPSHNNLSMITKSDLAMSLASSHNILEDIPSRFSSLAMPCFSVSSAEGRSCPVSFASLLHNRVHQSWAFQRWSLKINQLVPLFFLALYHMWFFQPAKVCFLEVWGSDSVPPLSHCTQGCLLTFTSLTSSSLFLSRSCSPFPHWCFAQPLLRSYQCLAVLASLWEKIFLLCFFALFVTCERAMLKPVGKVEGAHLQFRQSCWHFSIQASGLLLRVTYKLASSVLLLTVCSSRLWRRSSVWSC